MEEKDEIINEMTDIERYAAIQHPEVDYSTVTIWEVGYWQLLQIYPHAKPFRPNFIASIQNNHEYLPHIHLNFWKDKDLFFWQCSHCYFWCEISAKD